MTPYPPASLGDVVELRAGYGFPKDLQGRSSGDIPFAKVGDISRIARAGGTSIAAADNYVAQADLAHLRARIFPAGTVFFAKIGEAIRQNYRVIGDSALLVDNNAMGAIPSADVDSRYLFRYLQTVDMYSLTSSTTVPALRKSELERLQIPLPHLPEQRRIAAILDHADELRAKRRRSLALLDELSQSIFIDMFGDLISNEHRWPSIAVGDLFKAVVGGRNIVGSDYSSALRVLKVSAVTSLKYRENESKPLPVGYEPPSEHIVRRGDLLFSRANTSELVGATTVVGDTAGNAVLPDKLWRLVPEDEFADNSVFLAQVMQRPTFRRKVSDLATGSSGSMKNISKPKLLSIRLGMPPASDRMSFVRRYDEIQRQITVVERSAMSVDPLFRSLQARAFRGEL